MERIRCKWFILVVMSFPQLALGRQGKTIYFGWWYVHVARTHGPGALQISASETLINLIAVLSGGRWRVEVHDSVCVCVGGGC